MTPETGELILDTASPALPIMPEYPLLQRIVDLAALCCDTERAGFSVRREGAHHLLAGQGLVGSELTFLPNVAAGEVVTFQPPETSGLKFAAVVGLPGTALLFVLGHNHRALLTPAQTQCLRTLAAQAEEAMSLHQQLQAGAIYKRAFHSANVDLVLISIARDGDIRFEDANPVHLDHIGVPAERLIGATPEEVLGPTAIRPREI